MMAATAPHEEHWGVVRGHRRHRPRRRRRGRARDQRAAQRAHPHRHQQPARRRDQGRRVHGRLVPRPRPRGPDRRRAQGPRASSCASRAAGPGPSLLLLAHEDVVPANAADWQVPPFSGLIKDGYVWGRGAVDIKNLVAAHAVATARLAAAGGPAAGTLVYACTADEEEGSVGGARWLVEQPPRPREDRLRDQRGRGALPRARRAPRLPRRERREGHGPVPPHHQRRGRPRVRAAAQRQRGRRRRAGRRGARLASSCRSSSTPPPRTSCACSSTRPRSASACATRTRRARPWSSSRAATSSSPT